jgi:hypothetical protein
MMARITSMRRPRGQSPLSTTLAREEPTQEKGTVSCRMSKLTMYSTSSHRVKAGCKSTPYTVLMTELT